ncbi:AAA family ATPase [Clostridium oryzae]|uniref:ATPase AAA-type core domain-containing protein n=1 Tax=Clostridium oryzae TaxID=1450648 RepID=A0A1V4IRA9_9CLOT|nr:AAA family ATPase [Clostridium oryzae]OPJ62552.1 hypothetical protein CLORY_16820 [Clostridium oryzae]
MIYLNAFRLPNRTLSNPNIYPYNVFAKKNEKCLLFDKITILYGNNACGKSTLLNIIANSLNLIGKEEVKAFGLVDYFNTFINECAYELGEDDEGQKYSSVPENSSYIKSEDIMYEVKKIQQEAVLKEGYVYEHAKKGYNKEQRDELKKSKKMHNQIDIIKFCQEKYSNGEMSLQVFDDYLQANALFLLDEPEVSLSPQNQVLLAEKINSGARFFNNQFIIATHSPFMLGTLAAKIYNFDSQDMDVCSWSKLENVRYFYDYFKKHQNEFEE